MSSKIFDITAEISLRRLRDAMSCFRTNYQKAKGPFNQSLLKDPLNYVESDVATLTEMLLDGRINITTIIKIADNIKNLDPNEFARFFVQNDDPSRLYGTSQ